MTNQERAEPLALVSMACRFPGGVATPEELWTLIENDRQAIGTIPESRFDTTDLFDADRNAPGKIYTRAGGFLGDLRGFDADFFNISPREARSLDPQMRLLLEVAWELFERAGIVPGTMAKSLTGVYIGLSMSPEYITDLQANQVDAYTALGNSHSTIAGRLSYFFDLRGPNMAIDTACSSALLALHLACQAVRAGECTMAIAGGVNLLQSRREYLCFSRLQTLSPTGRCHTFSAQADGYVRAEGCGLVLVMPLSEAQRLGHPVLAVVLGSATNQDGHTPGLAFPSQEAQEEVIRLALKQAQVDPASIAYVECHGTGTKVGDPIEVRSVANTYGKARTRGKVLLGALKPNIGHSEAASGIAGLIKAVEGLAHQRVPRMLPVPDPNPEIEWQALAVEFAGKGGDWPTQRPRRASVNSFGYSGTNVHVILEESPDSQPSPHTSTPDVPVPLLVSGRRDEALQAQMEMVARHLKQNSKQSLVDVALSLATTRTQFKHRSFVVASNHADALRRLESPHGTVAPDGPAACAWLFTGQGSQWAGMGAGLYKQHSLFRQVIDELAAQFREHVDLVDLVVKREAAAQLADTRFAQIALFSLEVALGRLWEACGVRPRMTLGHSIGEIAAAHMAGVFDLPSACKLVAARAQLMGNLPKIGAMASIGASEAQVREALAQWPSDVEIAALNGPQSIVISGDTGAVEQIVAEFLARKHRATRLQVSHAFHSRHMEPMLAEFGKIARSIQYSAARFPIVSNVTGRQDDGALSSPDYWLQQIRQPVRFAEGFQTLLSAGCRVFLEVGAEPHLSGLAMMATPSPITCVPSLSSRGGGLQDIAHAAGTLHGAGVPVNWSSYFEPFGGSTVNLPTYAFQRREYWLAPFPRPARPSSHHSILGDRVPDPDRVRVFEDVWTPESQPWVRDHVIMGKVVVPAAAWIEISRAAAQHALPGRSVTIEHLAFEAPLILDENTPICVRTSIEQEASGALKVTIHSRPNTKDEAGWTRHASGNVSDQEHADARVDLNEIRARCTFSITREALHTILAESGFAFGPLFQGFELVQGREGESIADLSLSPSNLKVGITPMLLDSAFQVATVVYGSLKLRDQTYVPFSLTRFTLLDEIPSECTVVCNLVDHATEGSLSASIRIYTREGKLVAEAERLNSRTIDTARMLESSSAPPLWTTLWQPRKTAAASLPSSGSWVLRKDEAGLAQAFSKEVQQPGLYVEVLDDRLSRLELASRLKSLPQPVHGVALLLGQPPSTQVDAAQALARSQIAVQWAQAVVEAELEPPPRVWVVTRGAQSVFPGEHVALAETPCLGIARTLAVEVPALRMVALDLRGSLQEMTQALRQELAGNSDESEVAWRGGARFVPRLQRHNHNAISLPKHGWKLENQHPGQLSGLCWAPRDERSIGPDEVRIAVRAAGLNFRDVLNALGMYPGQVPLGAECAGVVTEVGDQVQHFAPGDEVMGLAPGMADSLVTDWHGLAKKPKNVTMEQAAGIPIAFATAWYALHDLAKLKKGQTILIHAAAGGVGMAAQQVARQLGAQVLATASTGKWDTLAAMGVEHVGDSRDLSFVEMVKQATQGRGVDVVLNSLAGEFVDASLRLLKPGGVFLEMGKTDVRSTEAIAQLRSDVAYRPFDLMDAGAIRLSEILQTLSGAFADKVLQPIPTHVVPATQVRSAFRGLADARGIGKTVVQMPRAATPVDGAVLITGGLGALGSAVARWFVQQRGIKHLVLCGHSATAVARGSELAAELQALGAESVGVLQADVTKLEDVRRLAAAAPSGVPIVGIVHAAGVLQDGTLSSVSNEALAYVFGPKVDGACHLHHVFGNGLEFFVSFSSVASALGSPGQTSYAAANAFLDGLAKFRHATGGAAQSINWGLWETGIFLGKTTKVDLARLARVAGTPIGLEEGTQWLGMALEMPATQLGAFRLNPRALAAGVWLPSLLRNLATGAKRSAGEVPKVDVAALAKLAPNDQMNAILDVVRTTVARVLQMDSPTDVGTEQPFSQMGLDSLTGVEIRNMLCESLGVSLSMTILFETERPMELAKHLQTKMFPMEAQGL